MSEAQAWITTTYRDVAQAAIYSPQATIITGFEDGQDAYWSQDGNPQQKAAKTIVLEILETLDDAMQRDARYPVLVLHPGFALGYIAGYVQAYLEATAAVADRDAILPPSQHHYELPTRQWLTTTYLDIALKTERDPEALADAYEEGQGFFYAKVQDDTLERTDRDLVLEMLKMFDEAMREDLSLNLPASPNWSIGFLAGYVQAYVQQQQSKTEPLPQLVEEEAECNRLRH